MYIWSLRSWRLDLKVREMVVRCGSVDRFCVDRRIRDASRWRLSRWAPRSNPASRLPHLRRLSVLLCLHSLFLHLRRASQCPTGFPPRILCVLLRCSSTTQTMTTTSKLANPVSEPVNLRILKEDALNCRRPTLRWNVYIPPSHKEGQIR
jgi:hypothetical protein